MFASLTPMRFAGGQTHVVRRQRRWAIQRLYGPDGREMLYILTFYLPRYLDLPFREKLTTVLHEPGTSGRSSTATCGGSASAAMPTARPRNNTTPTLRR